MALQRQTQYTGKMSSFSKFFLTSMIANLAILNLSACNLFGGIDKPKGDLQLLDAARACLDQGDFICAKEYYQYLSQSYHDVKTSEGSLAILGENNIFFISDLISSLGSGTGGASTLIALSQTLKARGKTDPSTFLIIQKTYERDLQINDLTLKAFSQFISSVAMMSAILANAVGPDQLLTASDLASTPSTCKGLNSATCTASATCNDAAGGSLPDGVGDVVSMESASNWNGDASIIKFQAAAAAADTASNQLITGSSGIFAAISLISQITGATDQQKARCTRMYLLQTFFDD
jgi:hypothetical protein